MKKTQHTPGPWEVRALDRRSVRIGTGARAVVQDTHRCHLEDEEARANARLIAAAPDLLEACQTALALIKANWPEEHGSESVGVAWGTLETAINEAIKKS